MGAMCLVDNSIGPNGLYPGRRLGRTLGRRRANLLERGCGVAQGDGDLMAEVNARISEFATGLNVGGDWDFHCECGAPSCMKKVAISLAEYGALRQPGQPVLASGHEPSRLAETRATAHELVDDARALRGQARHQLGRARRALGSDAEDSISGESQASPFAGNEAAPGVR